MGSRVKLRQTGFVARFQQPVRAGHDGPQGLIGIGGATAGADRKKIAQKGQLAKVISHHLVERHQIALKLPGSALARCGGAGRQTGRADAINNRELILDRGVRSQIPVLPRRRPIPGGIFGPQRIGPALLCPQSSQPAPHPVVVGMAPRAFADEVDRKPAVLDPIPQTKHRTRGDRDGVSWPEGAGVPLQPHPQAIDRQYARRFGDHLRQLVNRNPGRQRSQLIAGDEAAQHQRSGEDVGRGDLPRDMIGQRRAFRFRRHRQGQGEKHACERVGWIGGIVQFDIGMHR